jgi:hypothetical protein
MSEGSERDRRRLGQLVLARRKELGLSIREAARRASVMRPTWTGLEQGTRRTADYNFAAMERTLEWGPGSIESILSGGDAVSIGALPGPRAAETATAPADRPAAGPVDQPTDGTAVLWTDIVRVLDAQLGAIGRAASAGGTQRLWGAEQITALARRLRPGRVPAVGGMVVPWPDVVVALEATIAGIHADTGMTSEARLWGIEVIVDVAAELKTARRSLDLADGGEA